MRRRHFAALGLAVLLALSLAGCGGEKAEEERTSGLYYEACGISPDAVLLTVDGREVPAWRYLYWLTWGCDQLSEAYDAAGLTLDWSETVEGTDLASYVRQQALDNTVLYATVENWAEQYQVEITEADQPELDSLWAKQAEEAGGEEEYLAQMADRGLERSEAEALCADALLYRKLSQLSAESGSAVAPAEGAVEAFAEEQGYLTLEWLTVPVDEEADRESCRQQAASLFSQINASTDPAAAFAALEETYGTGEGGRTFLPGRGILPAAVEEAAETLEEDQWSGILEADDGFYLLLRRPLDTDAVAADYFDSRLQQAAQEADIVTTSAFDALEVPAFYERLTAARDRAEEDGET